MSPRARRGRFVGIVLSSMIAGFGALIACSDSEEGERCEEANNSADCAEGLRCTAVGLSSSRCCPPDRANATTAVCALTASQGGEVPPDAAEAAATTDAPADTRQVESSATETGTDAAADADADDDGG